MSVKPTLATPDKAIAKEQSLRAMMRETHRVLVAYSGGVDSTYLAAIAFDELGERSLAVLGISPSVSEFQRTQARAAARELGLNYREIETDEIADPRYAANPVNRCYFCKSELFSRLATIADTEGYALVVDGMNADDVSDHRPGKMAAMESKVESPLAAIGLTKSEIRFLSKRRGIQGWEKPASPCLASRIAYGVPVTIERLLSVERAEDVLRKMGFVEFRVRAFGSDARVELSRDEVHVPLDAERWIEIHNGIKEIGFSSVTLDERGFRSGALNEVRQTEAAA